MHSKRTIDATRYLSGAAFAALALSVTVGTTLVLFAAGANASPLALAKNPAIHSDLVLVRDGCGEGRRFSNNRQRCVRINRDRDDDDRDVRRGHRNRTDLETAVDFFNSLTSDNQRNQRHKKKRVQQQPGADGQDD